MNASLVLSGDELLGLVALKGRAVAEPFQQILEEMRANASGSIDILSALQDRRLAQMDGNALKIEPLLNLIVEEAVAARSAKKEAPGSYSVECPNMCLLVTRYEWAEGMWRITPFKDILALESSLE